MLQERSYTRITLALDIVRKLDTGPYTGYHELRIIKHQIDLYDVISLEPAEQMRITCDNPAVPVDERNLCRQVADTVRKQFDIQENVHITIEKNIPVQGGLAGGSANAATLLQMLNIFWNCNGDTKQLVSLGRSLGMDIPFYFTGKTAFDTETTGICESIPTQCTFTLVLAIPDFGVATQEAYSRIDYSTVARNTQKTIQMRQALTDGNQDAVIASVHNDFEESVFKQYPQLKQLKEELINAGCLNAVMSGSGSTIIGIAEDREHAEEIQDRISTSCIITSTL